MKPAADMFKYFLVLIAIVSVSRSYSQYVYDYKRSADKFYAEGDYFSAAGNYEKLLDQKSVSGGSTEPYTVQGKGAKTSKGAANRHEVVYRIAESYRQLNNYLKAEQWYAEAAGYKSGYPLATYWYGVALRANGKFAEAETTLRNFLNTYTVNDKYKELAAIELADVKFIQEQLSKKDIQLYSVSGVSVNGTGADYAAGWNNNNLLFTSTRADSSVVAGKNKNPFVNNLYLAQNTDGVFGSIQKITIPVTDNMEQGVASVSPDGSVMYFTRWTKKNGRNLAAIYVSQMQNGSWKAPERLANNINVDGYSSQQPHITTDGKYLLFASDRPGGAGGFDLYYTSLSNGHTGSVNNFGTSINTKEDDQAPYYYQRDNTLVFATKGRVGMGGYDLFESRGIIGGNWQEPKNLGYPVNSIKDDIYFFNKGTDKLLKEAYISSDRSSECCLQLLSVNKIYSKYVSGKVVDCKTNQPLAADIKITGANSSVIGKTNDQGTYVVELNSFQPMQIVASKENYSNANLQFNQPATNSDTLFNPVLCLTPALVEVVTPPQPEKEKKELKAYFDFAKYDLRPETGQLLDTIIALLKREPKLGIEIYGYTDKKGSDGYNMNLSKLRAEACKAYLLQNGISATRTTVIAKGECCEVQPENKANGSDDAVARQANRRVEFKIVLQGL
jgi:outer membrane protein OmpA-like peptidoglycan-associated protein